MRPSPLIWCAVYGCAVLVLILEVVL